MDPPAGMGKSLHKHVSPVLVGTEGVVHAYHFGIWIPLCDRLSQRRWWWGLQRQV